MAASRAATGGDGAVEGAYHSPTCVLIRQSSCHGCNVIVTVLGVHGPFKVTAAVVSFNMLLAISNHR